MVAGVRIPLLALLAAALLAGCGGGGDSIPAEDAEVLLNRLDEVEAAVAEGNCDGAADSAALLQEQVGDGPGSRVPRSVDSDVREALQEGAGRLVQLVEEQCEEPAAPEEEVEPVEPVEPVPTPPVEPPPTEPPPTEEDDAEDAPPGQDRGSGSRGGGRGGDSEPSGGIAE